VLACLSTIDRYHMRLCSVYRFEDNLRWYTSVLDSGDLSVAYGSRTLTINPVAVVKVMIDYTLNIKYYMCETLP